MGINKDGTNVGAQAKGCSARGCGSRAHYNQKSGCDDTGNEPRTPSSSTWQETQCPSTAGQWRTTDANRKPVMTVNHWQIVIHYHRWQHIPVPRGMRQMTVAPRCVQIRDTRRQHHCRREQRQRPPAVTGKRLSSSACCSHISCCKKCTR